MRVWLFGAESFFGDNDASENKTKGEDHNGVERLLEPEDSQGNVEDRLEIGKKRGFGDFDKGITNN